MSEFGKGVVVCLVKFSEHLNDDMMQRVVNINEWLNISDEKRNEMLTKALANPRSDAAKFIGDCFLFGNPPDEKTLSDAILMWANGASDHFFDLDKEKSPASLIRLGELALEIGHGYKNFATLWTIEHIETLKELWRESCLELDKILGIEDGDFGEW